MSATGLLKPYMRSYPNTSMQRLTRILLLWSTLLLSAFPAKGLEIGEIRLQSHLHQPLRAEIPLQASADERETLQLKLADPLEFARLGLQPARWMCDLYFKIETGASGKTHILVRSHAPLHEPYVFFLLQADWAKGRRVHQYDLLLDPLSPPSLSRPPNSKARAPAATPATVTEYGPVRNGESLWVIAKKLRPDKSVSVPQMMDELYRHNPRAFVNGNRNLLIKGAVLRLPGATDDADAPVAEHATQEAPAAAGKNTANEAEKNQQPIADSLRILPMRTDAKLADGAPGATAEDSPASAGLRAALLRTREENAELKAFNDELREKLSLLEEQVRFIQNILLVQSQYENIRRQNMAQTQKPGRKPAPPMPEPDELEAEPASAAVEEIEPSYQPPPEPALDSELWPEPEPLPVPEAIEETDVDAPSDSLIGKLKSLLPVLGSMLAVLLVLGVLLARKEIFETFQTLMIKTRHRDMIGETGFNLQQTIDHIDVCLSKGELQEADQLLGLTSLYAPLDPKVMFKTLELYALKNDQRRFFAYMLEVRSTLMRDAPAIWRKVVQIGRQLDPDHALLKRT